MEEEREKVDSVRNLSYFGELVCVVCQLCYFPPQYFDLQRHKKPQLLSTELRKSSPALVVYWVGRSCLSSALEDVGSTT
jgi:hypothetical protein